MDQGLKKRLLGAGMLILAIVILAPALFRGGESHPLVTDTNITELKKRPEKPDFIAVLDTPQEFKNVNLAESYPVKDKNAQPGLDSEGHLKAWTLQLATFSDESNAISLHDTLLAQGHSVYVRKTVHKKNHVLFRVCIGPEVRTNDLRVLKDKFKKEMGLSGIIVQFEI